MSYTKEDGITLPGEAKDKCCWFIPIKMGVYAIGIIMCLWAFNAVRMALAAFGMMGTSGMYLIYGIGYAVSAAPILLGAWFFIKFFRAPDDADTRAGLKHACMLVILSSLILAGIAAIQFLLVTGATFSVLLNALISAGITSVCYFYYAGVCDRYVKQL